MPENMGLNIQPCGIPKVIFHNVVYSVVHTEIFHLSNFLSIWLQHFSPNVLSQLS